MLTTRRKNLLLAIPVLLVPLTGVLVMGSVEVTIWLSLVIAWLALFITWGGNNPQPRIAEQTNHH